jgi:hypothetical protein
MAGTPGHGGQNKLSLATHRARNTYQPHRHGGPSAPPPVPVSRADRRRVLVDLDPEGRKVAAAILDRFGDWNAGALRTLRSYCLSCQRLTALERASSDDPRALHRELRANMHLWKTLGLEVTW